MDQPKIERVLRLMKMMTSGNRYTVEELAERLDTSYRSIYRYIDTFKEVGFVVHKEEGGVYRLGKESPYFKDISQLIHFTDEEAHIVNQLIGALDDTNMLKQNLRRKLSSVYNCTSLANSIVKGKNAENVNQSKQKSAKTPKITKANGKLNSSKNAQSSNASVLQKKVKGINITKDSSATVRLKSYAVSQKCAMPIFRDLSEDVSGVYKVECRVGEFSSIATGKTRSTARESAASILLKKLK